MLSQTNKQAELTGYPSIDKPWLRYYSEDVLNTKPSCCSVFENIYNANKGYPNGIALLYFGKKITYRKMFEEIDKTAKAFASYGVKSSDNVVLCMPATPEAIYAILALNKLGANADMLNPTFSEQQLEERIKETNATCLVVLHELYGKVQNIMGQSLFSWDWQPHCRFPKPSASFDMKLSQGIRK